MGMTSLYVGQVGSREDLSVHHSKLEQFCGNEILLINENDLKIKQKQKSPKHFKAQVK